jgi:hypothetical protein
MSITFPLCTGLEAHFGGPTVTASKNIGTGANRMAFALSGYDATGSQPAGVSLGSDALTLIGSLVTMGTGTKWALYQGALTQSGVQTITATYSGSFASGFSQCIVLVAQSGVGALTFANALAVAEQDLGAAGGSSRTITSAVGDVAIVLDIGLVYGTPTAQSPAALITNDFGAPFWALQSAGQASSTTIQTNWAEAETVIHTGFTLTEPSTGKLFRTNPSGNLSGLGSSGPFFQNPLQRVADVWKRRNGIFVPLNYFNREALA